MAGARTLVAKFTGDTSGLEASTKRAQKALGGFDKSAGKTGAGLKKLAAFGAGGALAAGVVSFGKSSVKAFTDAQASQQKLTDAFARFPATADVSVKSLQDYNSELAKKTKFDDDATASGEAVLAQFKLTGKQIKSLTPLLQDYAAKTGKDLPGAALDLGKALQGQGRALKAVGINFVDTGSAAGNLDELTGALRKQVGGFAEKEGKTAAGQAEILKNQFGELQENVGAKLVPALLALSKAGLAVLDFMQRNEKVIKPLLIAVGGLAASVWAVNKATAVWAATTRATSTVLGLFTRSTVASTVATEEQAVALSTVGRASKLAAGAFGVIGLAVTAAIALPTIYNKLADVLHHKTIPALEDTQSALIDIGRHAKTKQAAAALDDFGSSLDRLFNKTGFETFKDKVNAPFVALGFNPAFKAARDNLTQLDKSLADLVGSGYSAQAKDQFDALATAAHAHGVSVEELRKKFPSYADALKGLANEQKLAGGATHKTTGEFNGQATAAERLQGVLGDLGAMFDTLFGTLTTDKATAGFQASLDDMTGKVVKAKGAFEQNRTALDLNSAAGRDLLDVIDSQATSLADLSTATLNQTHSQVQARIVWNQGVAALKAQWVQAGLTEEQIKALTTRYGLVPRGVSTAISTTGIPAASSEIASYNEKLGKIPATVITRLAIEEGSRRKLAALTKQGFAGGGPVFGPGGPRSDVVPAWLSSGEYVINAFSAARIGMATLDRLNRMSVGGPVPRLAGGGRVSAGVGGTTVNNYFSITGAVDPEGVARQIKKIVGGHDRRVGMTAAV